MVGVWLGEWKGMRLDYGGFCRVGRGIFFLFFMFWKVFGIVEVEDWFDVIFFKSFFGCYVLRRGCSGVSVGVEN